MPLLSDSYSYILYIILCSYSYYYNTKSLQGHSGAVTAMHVIPAREPEARRQGLAGGLITGSTDGKLQLWNSRLELGRCLDCVPLLGPQNPLVHSCTWDEPNHKLLVAFWSAEVSNTCACRTM